MLRLALCVPALVGANVTVIEQEALGATAAQLLLCENCSLAVPEIATERPRVFGLVFCTTAFIAPLVPLTGTLPKFNVPGCTVKVGCRAATRRMRELNKSVTNMRPDVSTATPQVSAISACVAAPPSPEKPKVPSPAIVAIWPLGASTKRITLLYVSAM